MIHILWGLLNLFLLVVFIKTLYQSALILNKELSRFSAVVLLLGLISYACGPGNEVPEEKVVWDNEKVAETDPLPSGEKELVVEDRLAYSWKIKYYTGKDSLGNKIIAKAVWIENGLKAFTQNHLEWFDIDCAGCTDAGNSADDPSFVVRIREEWYLLGFRVYTVTKNLKGPMFD